MIIKRLVIGIKNQDWFVVLVEVMIVVVGIFIGLQVDDWNEARKELIIEKSFLERLSQDLKNDIIQINRGRELSLERQAYGDFLYATLKDPSLVQKDPTRFMKAVEATGRTFSPSISSHTFEEIKSSGQLSLIRDVKFRSNLTRYYLSTQYTAQWGYIRELVQTEYIKRAVGILDYEQKKKLFTTDGVVFSFDEAQKAYARMIAKPEFLEWLTISNNRQGAINRYKFLSAEAMDLLNTIK